MIFMANVFQKRQVCRGDTAFNPPEGTPELGACGCQTPGCCQTKSACVFSLTCYSSSLTFLGWQETWSKGGGEREGLTIQLTRKSRGEQEDALVRNRALLAQ